MKKRQIMAFALCAVMVLGLAASGGQSESQPADSTAPDKPDGFVDNGAGIDEIDEAYLFESDLDAGITLGRRDSSVYCAGEPMGLMFATNLITADPDGDASEGFPLARIWNRVDHVRFGSHEYKLDELVRPRDQGFQVLEMLAADFGVVQYKQDPETGSLEGAAKLGSLRRPPGSVFRTQRPGRLYGMCVLSRRGHERHDGGGLYGVQDQAERSLRNGYRPVSGRHPGCHALL